MYNINSNYQFERSHSGLCCPLMSVWHPCIFIPWKEFENCAWILNWKKVMIKNQLACKIKCPQTMRKTPGRGWGAVGKKKKKRPGRLKKRAHTWHTWKIPSDIEKNLLVLLENINRTTVPQKTGNSWTTLSWPFPSIISRSMHQQTDMLSINMHTVESEGDNKEVRYIGNSVNGGLPISGSVRCCVSARN